MRGQRFLKQFGAIRLVVAILLMALVFPMLLSVQPASAVYWKQKFVRFSAIAGETLATGDLVYLKSTDGKAWKADASDVTKSPAVGMIGKGGAADETVEIIVSGVADGLTEATVGDKLYTAAHPGSTTTTKTPAMLAFKRQKIGMYTQAHPGYYRTTQALINVQEPAHEDWQDRGY